MDQDQANRLVFALNAAYPDSDDDGQRMSEAAHHTDLDEGRELLDHAVRGLLARLRAGTASMADLDLAEQIAATVAISS